MGPHGGKVQVVRHVRAAVLSAVVLVASLLAHVSGGGGLPPATGLVAGWALLSVLLSPMTRHQLGLPLVLGLLTSGQLVVHMALREAAAAAPTVTAATARMTLQSSAHDHQVPTNGLPSEGAVVLVQTTAWNEDGGWMMPAAHLLAAGAVGLWLVAGERAAMQLLQVVTVVVLRSVEDLAVLLTGLLGCVCLVVTGPPVPARRDWYVTTDARELALGSSSRRRGPPAREF